MTRLLLGVALLTLPGMLGCAAETGPGETSSELSTVLKADYEGQVRYIDEAVSLAPLTAEELGDTTYAIPVQVHFYDDFAVAWWVRHGVAQSGDPDMAVAAWRIVEHVPTAGELDRSGSDEPSTTEPRAPESATLVDGTDLRATTSTLEAGSDFRLGDHLRELPFARLDWMKDELDVWRTRPPEYHPGCI